jgi:hypothetical protein
MRQTAPIALAAALAAAPCALAVAAPAPPPAPAQPAPTQRVQTTAEANRQGIAGVAQAPLRDLNVVRTKIPKVLQEAMADPYKRPAIGSRASRKTQCAHLVALIRPLDDALGADLDVPSNPDESLLEKGRGTALEAAADLASSMIPFRSWVRKLSGAERHDQMVRAAITAGAVRRAYLKGLGEAHGCNPPATPSHMLSSLPHQDETQNHRSRWTPLYPIR